MNAQNLEFLYGEKPLAFTLRRRRRKTLSISVKPNMVVEVVAPHDAPIQKILEKVRKRTPWILKQIRFFSQFQPRTPDRQFIAGETHLYLGRQYKLKVVPHIQERVKVHRGRIVVQSLKPRQPHVTQGLLEDWYRDRAHVKFRERLLICQNRFPNPKEFEPSGIIVRQLKQRWGSMTARKTLMLNLSLIRASVDTIDYVITHELCHLRHDHHGAEFFKLLDRVMPDWEKRKNKLERLLA